MKNYLLKTVLSIVAIFLISNSGYSANEFFRSVASGDWNSNSTWEMSTNGGGTWFAATSTPKDTSGQITVRSPNTVTVTVSDSADQLTVNSGGILSINTGIVLTIKDGSGDDLFLNNGGIISGLGTLQTQGAGVLMDVRGSGFNAALKVNTGTTRSYDLTVVPAVFNGSVTVDAGATFSVVNGGYTIQANGIVTNNGKIATASGNGTFIMNGPTLVNNDTIRPGNLNFNSTTSLSGTGAYSGSVINILGSGNVSLANNVTFSPTSAFNINNGGTLNPNTRTFNFNSGTCFVFSGGTVANSGIFQTQGAVSMIVKNGSNFNAPFKVNTGTTASYDNAGPFIANYNGTMTVDAGAILTTQAGGYSNRAYGVVTNNGTITGNNFIMRGATLTNTGSITSSSFQFDSTTSLSGTGTYTSNIIIINPSGNVSLSNDITFVPGTSFTIDAGGTLNPTNIFTFENGTFVLMPGGNILNSGTFRTRDTVTLNIRGGSNFQAPLNVNTGVTTLLDLSSPFNAPVYGNITVDAGAVLAGGNGGYTIVAYNNLINNGMIVGSSSTAFSMRGQSLLNTGSITIPNLRFDSTTALSGTGSYSSPNSFINSSGIVSLSNNVIYTPGSTFTINSGGVFNPNGNFFTLASGTFLVQPGGTVVNSGTFRTQDTVTLHIRNGAFFNVALLVNTGLTNLFDPASPFVATLYGTLTVDAGATLVGGNGGYTIIAMSSVTNNGTIQGVSSTTFKMRGPNMINNNIVSIQNMHFDSTTTLSGTGTYTSPTMVINASGNVSLTTNMIFSPGSVFVINTGGILNLNSNTLFFTSGTLTLHNGATILNSGLIQTEGAVTMDIRVTANFNVPLKIHTGTTFTYCAASPFNASLNGPVTVDSGATWHANSGGYTLFVNDDITSNGTIAGNVAAMRFFGGDLINNGSITVNVFNFEAGAHTLQGTGSWATLGRFLTGSTTTLLSTHQMLDINISSGGTFDITSRKLLLSGGGTPITNNGTFITTGSTIEYNGTAAQAAAAANVVYHSLTINNAAGVSLTSARTVPGILTLTLGVFSNGVNLTMGNGATIVRQDGSLSAVPTFGASLHVIYIGANPTNSSFELPAATTVLRNLTINNSGGVTLTAPRTVNDTLFLINGTFSNGANLTFADGATINRSAGSLNSVPTFGTTVNVIYSDTTAVLTGNEIPVSPTILNNLTINNTGGVTLSANTTANGILTLLNGLLIIGPNTLTLGASSTVAGTPSNSKMIVASGTGTVRKNFTGIGSFLFPVGDNTGTNEYSPITLNFVSGTFGAAAYAEVNLKNVKQPDNQSPTHYLNRYWTVAQNDITSFSCGVTGVYVDADVVGNELTMWTGSWNGSSWTLLNQADAVNNQISGTVAGFSDFTGGRKSEMGGTINTFMTSGSFSDPTKWSNEKLPLAGDAAIIGANCVVDVTFPNLSSLTVNSGVTLDMSTFALPNIATINNSGTIKTQNAGLTPLPSGITYLGTIEYNAGGAQTVVNSTYTNLTISGSGIKSMNGSFTVESSLNLNGGSLSIGANTLTINGSIVEGGGTLSGGLSSNIVFGGTAPNDKIMKSDKSAVFIKNDKDEMSSTILPAVTLNNLTINRASGIGLSGNVTVEGILILQSGALSINSHTLELNGSINITGGSLVGGLTSNLTIGGSGPAISLPPISLNNLTLNRASGATLTGASTINGILTLTNGTLTNGSNLILASGATIDRKEGTLNSIPTFGTTVNVVYSGTNLVSTGNELPASTTVLRKLRVNNPGDVTLTSSITVNDTLSIVKGHFNLNGNIITLSLTGYLTETDSNTINGSTGYIVAVRTLNAPTSMNVAGLGAIITTGSNMGSTEIRRGHTIQTDSGTQSIARYYDIFPTNNTSLNATFIFKYDETELNGNAESNLVLFRSTDNGLTWEFRNGIVFPSQNEIALPGVNEFSRWTAGDSVTSLPVELASFSSNVSQRDVILNWTTSQEVNNSGFDIERSSAVNAQWSKLGFVQGNGTTNSSSNYSFNDRRLNTGKYYYRLRQIDYNGESKYYNLGNEIEIGVPAEYSLSQNYPNPFNPTTTIDYQVAENGKVSISLFDMTGKELGVLVNKEQQAGYYTIQFNASNLSSGTYFYRLVASGSSNNFIETKKMLIVK